jgi:3,4-dihydroxy 2-butanone 4-phosphate synthase / GTP cyclohydrolase II
VTDLLHPLPAAAAGLAPRSVRARVPTDHGDMEAICFEGPVGFTDHLVLLVGEIGEGSDMLVRVHSECLTGDVFGSHRCDCGTQLRAALDTIFAEGRGMVVYVLGHEGRGIGLLRKLEAYQLQEHGLDTVDANLHLGLPADARSYARVATILAHLGVASIRLLSNNPAKAAALEGAGVSIVGRVTLPVVVTPDNLSYLATKRDRMGHELRGLPAILPAPGTSR